MDYESIEDIVKQTNVVLSTVGPFARYGENLVAACAKNGTDYCDITGETHWVRRMTDKYNRDAVMSGAMLVPMCGFGNTVSTTTFHCPMNHCILFHLLKKY